MTDNEIIKALECCIKETSDCDNCPLYVPADADCINISKSGALDIINRLQAEIENLKDTLYDAEGVNLVNYWYQQCEIAENGNRNFDEENKKLKAENEKLKNENDSMRKDIAQSVKELKNFGVLYDKDISKSQAEAIKEFWGKLKKHSRKMQSSDFSGEFWDRAVLVEDGDNLLKEMVVETE